MAYETPQQDIQDLWSIYQTTKAQWEAAAAYKTTVMAALTTLLAGGTVDVASFSDSGEGGGEGVSVVSLTARLESAVTNEKSLADQMYAARLHAIKASPGWGVRHIPGGNLRRRW